MKLAGAVRGEPQGFDHIIRHLLIGVGDRAAGHFQVARGPAVQPLGQVAHRTVSPVPHPGKDQPHELVDRRHGLPKGPGRCLQHAGRKVVLLALAPVTQDFRCLLRPVHDHHAR